MKGDVDHVSKILLTSPKAARNGRNRARMPQEAQELAMLGMLLGNPTPGKEKGVTVARNPLELLVAGVRFELTTFGL